MPWLRLRKGLQDRLEGGTVRGGVAGVVGDEDPRTAAPGVPCAAQLAGALCVEPARRRIHVAAAAVVLADLADNHRNSPDRRADLAGPAGLGGAGVEVVGMPGRDQV